MLQDFIQAIHSKNKLRVIFYSKEDDGVLERVCAPMDYGPSRRARDQRNRYHFWDYDSDQRRHVLSLLPEQVVDIQVLKNKFSPAEFISWSIATSPWFVARDWGALYS